MAHYQPVLILTLLCGLFISGDAFAALEPVNTYTLMTPEQVCANSNRSNSECNCDPKCVYFNDCCRKTIQQGGYVNYKSLAQPSCVESITYSEEYPVFVWDKCPSSYQNEEVRKHCEEIGVDIVHHIPVYYTGTERNSQYLLFKNYYCAICNGLLETDIETPTKKFTTKCSLKYKPSVEQIPDLLHKKHCYIMGVIDDSNRMARRKCIPNLVQSCPPNYNQYTADRCSEGPAYRHSCMDDKRVYRNKDCVTCAYPGSHCVMTRAGQLTVPKFLGYFYNYDVILNFKKYVPTPPPPTTKTLDIMKNVTMNGTALNDTKIGASNTTALPSTMDQVGSILTMVCTIISIVSLIVLIGMYLVAKELRNLNGKMILILAFTLLFALVCFSTGPALIFKAVGCKVIAICIHYGYLCSFTWMALYSFELLRTFKLQNMTNASSSKLRKLFIYYCLAGFIFPAIVCGVAFLFDLLVTPENSDFVRAISPRYGEGMCYITSKWGRFAWIFLPVLIFIVFNTIVCGILFYFFLQSYKHVSQAIRSKKSLFFICLKITAILGVSWGFYMVTIFIGNAILSLIGAALNNLQGFFIMMCFLLNRKVIKTVKTSISRTSSSRASSRQSTGKNSATRGTKKERKPLQSEDTSSKANSGTYNTRSTTV